MSDATLAARRTGAQIVARPSSLLQREGRVVGAMPQDRHRPAKAYARPPLLSNERERIAALRRYGILDTLPEQAFDDLTLLAAHICRAPIALISLVDPERQWFKSRVGLDLTETPRDVAFCAHAIAMPSPLVVPDALADERFATNPLVLAEPHIRFYAGAPLRTAEGHALGTLCVIDHEPREFSPEQRQALEALSRQVMAQFELRRCQTELQRLSSGARR